MELQHRIAAGKRKIRIMALDGIRGLLALHIVFGHFLRFAGPSKFWMKFFAQVNVTVGVFFALSGYATAYTCTRVGENETSVAFQASSWKQWWVSKAIVFYKVHWFVLLLFGPFFVYSDVSAAFSVEKGLATLVTNGILSATLTQAWFPMGHAEIWNAPTWFLSSLVFCNLVLAIALPGISRMHKGGLRIASIWLYWINLLPVLGYFWISRNTNCWRLVEGTTRPIDHPSLGLFNVVRFFPVCNAAETLMGALACRLVMLDSSLSRNGRQGTEFFSSIKRSIAPTVSVMIPFGTIIGMLAGRATDWIPDCSDLLIRKCIVIPVFLNLAMALHRNALLANQSTIRKDPVSILLSTNAMVWLGNLSFPVYILHGPIGQVFYKRAIATKLWGGVLRGKGYFALYLATVLLTAILVQKMFSNRSIVNAANKK